MDILKCLDIYGNIILEFLLELYIYCFLVMIPLKKKQHFFKRLILGGLIVLAIAFPLSILYYYVGNNIIGRIIIYIILLLVSYIHFIYMIEDRKEKILVHVDFGYIIQNMGYLILVSLWELLTFLNIIPDFGPGIILYKVFYYLFNLAIGTFLYFMFIKKGHKHISDYNIKATAIWLSIIIVLANNVLCSVFDVFFQNLTTSGDYSFQEPVYFYIRFTTHALSILLSGCVIYLLFNSQERYDLEKDVEHLNYIIAQSKKQYELSEELIDTINIKCHDMRHRISAMLSEDVSKDTMKDITDTIRIYDASIKTGNKTLDTILTEKSLLCEKNQITLTCMADGSRLQDSMEYVDICCLFGNIMDNAIEAVKEIGDIDRRVIDFTIRVVGSMAIIQCQNYYDGNLNIINGEIHTTKSDLNYHGFGMQSIRRIAQKYGGEVSIDATGGIFKLNVVINLK